MKKICFIFVLLLVSFQLFADNDEKLKLAVMDLEDLSGKLSEETLAGASEYFRVIFAQTNRYIIISKDRQKEQISGLRKKYNTDPTYKSCTDKNCQIQLGQALSADLIVKTSVSFFAGFYTLASELIDLEKEATIIAATEEYDGTPQALRTAIKNIVNKIVEAEKKENSEPAPAAPVYREQPQQQQPAPVQSKDSRDCEQARQENSINAWRTYLRKHSEGECVEKAKENLDKMICEQAEDENSLKAWENYAKEFPNGNCIIKAEANIKALKEDAKIEQYSKQEELLKSFYSSADERMDRKFTGRYNFGIATAFDTPNKFGISTGFDFNFNVFQKPIGGGAGNLFVGFGFDFEYYAPTEDLEYNHTHLLEVPIMLNFGYDFRVNNYTLRYVGFWFSAGAGIDVFIWDSSDDDDWDEEDSKIYGSFAWELGFEMIFRNRFMMNFGFGGFAGEAYEYCDGSHFFFNIGTIF